MKRSPSKKKAGKITPDDASIKTTEKLPAGLPDPDSVVSEKVFKSPKGKLYRIFKTTEADAYDRPAGSKGRRKKAR